MSKLWATNASAPRATREMDSGVGDSPRVGVAVGKLEILILVVTVHQEQSVQIPTPS